MLKGAAVKKSQSTKLLKKITTTQNEAALSYHRLRGLYFPAVVFAATIYKFCFSFRVLKQLHTAYITRARYSRLKLLCALIDKHTLSYMFSPLITSYSGSSAAHVLTSPNLVIFAILQESRYPCHYFSIFLFLYV